MIEQAKVAQRVDIGTVPQVSNDYADLRHLIAQMYRAGGVHHVLQVGIGNGDMVRIASALMQECGGHVWVVNNDPAKAEWLKSWPARNVTVWNADPFKMDWRQKVDALYIHDVASYEAVKQLLIQLGAWVRSGGKVILQGSLDPKTGMNAVRAVHEWATETRIPWVHYPYQKGMAVAEVTYDMAVPEPVPSGTVVASGSPQRG